jgi:hypothetical protein
LKSSWILSSKKQAAILTSIEERIPGNAEVVASQGIIARFSFRKYVYGWSGKNQSYPINSKNVWFVITPSSGIETASVIESFALLDSLSGRLQAKLMEDNDNVFLFKLEPPPGTRYINTDLHTHTISAWTTPGPTGISITSGRSETWHAASNGKIGYVVSGDYWNASLGAYEASVTIKNLSPARVEVWNATSNTLLARSDLAANISITKVHLPFEVSSIVPQHGVYSGAGLFSYNPPSPRYKVDHIEIRIYVGRGGDVSVYKLSVKRVGQRS